MRFFTILSVLFLGAVMFSCEDKNESKPPVASFTISPSTGPFTQSFNFNASSSYDDDEATESLQVRWDFDGDGSFDTQYSTTKTAEYTYEGPDEYMVVLEVANSEGWTDTEEKQLIVFADSVPPMPSFYVEPDSSSVQTIFLFNSAASTDQYTPAGELRYRWDWEGDGTWDTPFITDTVFYHKYEEAGDYWVILEVKNSYSVTDTTGRIVYVYDL
ncbi:MAG: PKD domain-containing protein [Bacteroidales bacterium]|jgi:PKD repeat protein|nr:PKD domain-containing protein [Bacteroidales bacterium]